MQTVKRRVFLQYRADDPSSEARVDFAVAWQAARVRARGHGTAHPPVSERMMPLMGRALSCLAARDRDERALDYARSALWVRCYVEDPSEHDEGARRMVRWLLAQARQRCPVVVPLR